MGKLGSLYDRRSARFTSARRIGLFNVTVSVRWAIHLAAVVIMASSINHPDATFTSRSRRYRFIPHCYVADACNRHSVPLSCFLSAFETLTSTTVTGLRVAPRAAIATSRKPTCLDATAHQLYASTSLRCLFLPYLN